MQKSLLLKEQKIMIFKETSFFLVWTDVLSTKGHDSTALIKAHTEPIHVFW